MNKEELILETGQIKLRQLIHQDKIGKKNLRNWPTMKMINF